jgi:hypothetical protein
MKLAGRDPPTVTLNLGSHTRSLLLLFLLLLLLFLLLLLLRLILLLLPLLFDVQLAIFTFSPMLGLVGMEK